MKTVQKTSATIWKMWRCDQGAQWISASDWILTKQELTGHCSCPFSHGRDVPEHNAAVVGKTSDPEQAGKWFTRNEETP